MTCFKFDRIGRQIVLPLSLLALAQASHAALGEAQDAIAKEAQQLNASVQVTPQASFAVHDMHRADGSRIRQFVDAQGRVFAVRWNTYYKPDLATLLGTAWAGYSSAARRAAPGGAVHQFRHEDLDLVVQSSAYLHVHSGLAYRRSLLPVGVSLASLVQE